MGVGGLGKPHTARHRRRGSSASAALTSIALRGGGDGQGRGAVARSGDGFHTPRGSVSSGVEEDDRANPPSSTAL